MSYSSSSTAAVTADDGVSAPPATAPGGDAGGRVLWLRLVQIGTGHALYGSFNHFFDFVIYPYVVYTQGVILGGALMTLFSLLQCALLLVAYERMGVDWVGSGLLADIARKSQPSWFDRLVAWITNRNQALTFLLLCAVTDPFIVTAFFRRGSFDGLRARDWHLFFASVLVCNLYWIFVADLIARIAVASWHWIVGLIG
ncbi:MAG: hypothetical protein HONDAALG_00724 [Gammaproteobacteria bacterium]|nr:hypothetical protein [Gammaproteobacteria bacterium]